MKRSIAIIAFAAIMGFSFTACDIFMRQQVIFKNESTYNITIQVPGGTPDNLTLIRMIGVMPDEKKVSFLGVKIAYTWNIPDKNAADSRELVKTVESGDTIVFSDK
jgi:hypothetical protein